MTKILVVGDYFPKERVEDAFCKGNYSSVLEEVRALTAKADYSIANFEGSVVSGGETPIHKMGIHLGCSDKGVEALKWAGFNCVTMANNHIYDYGDLGLHETYKALNKNDFDTVGAGDCLKSASEVLYKRIGNYVFAFINCCEHEFSIATNNKGGANPLDPIKQYYTIKTAKSKSDYVIVIVHGGHEHYQLPSIRMQETYRFFIDSGADVVINHHQHCFSGFEKYNEKPIFYGLGNFCFDSALDRRLRGNTFHDGYAVMLTFNDKIIEHEIIPYVQCKDNPTVSLLKEKTEISYFQNKIDILNSIIIDIEKLQLQNKSMHEQRSNFSFMMSFYERVLMKLQKKGVLSRQNVLFRRINEKLIELKGVTNCESHFDNLKYNLDKYFNEIQ